MRYWKIPFYKDTFYGILNLSQDKDTFLEDTFYGFFNSSQPKDTFLKISFMDFGIFPYKKGIFQIFLYKIKENKDTFLVWKIPFSVFPLEVISLTPLRDKGDKKNIGAI